MEINKEIPIDTLEQLRDLSKLSPTFLPEKFALLILKNKALQEKIKTMAQLSKNKEDLAALLTLVEEQEIALKKLFEKKEKFNTEGMPIDENKKRLFEVQEKKFHSFELQLKKLGEQ